MITCHHCKKIIKEKKPFIITPANKGLKEMMFCEYVCFLNFQIEQSGIRPREY